MSGLSIYILSVNPPETDVLQAFFVLIFALCTSYSAGRLHQWYKHAHERDDAWRSGYDSATRSLFHLVTRTRRQEQTTVEPVRGVAAVSGRHAAQPGPRVLAPVARASDGNGAGKADLRVLEAG